MTRRRLAQLAAALVLAAVVVLAATLLPLARWSTALAGWIRGAGALGVLLYVVAYIVATLSLLPGSLLTMGAGFAYGPLWGSLLVSPVSVLAALLAWTLGRTLLRGAVSRRVARDARFVAIDRAVAQRGFMLVLLLRLSPVVPYNLANYGLALTAVGARDFIVASALGMLPGTILFVYLGSLAHSAGQLGARGAGQADAWRSALYWGGLACAVVVTVIVTRLARRALRTALVEAQP